MPDLTESDRLIAERMALGNFAQATVPGVHTPLLLIARARDDGDVDLIDYRTRAGMGTYRPIHPPLGSSGKVFAFVAALLITFAVGFMIWQLGRSYGREESVLFPEKRP